MTAPGAVRVVATLSGTVIRAVEDGTEVAEGATVALIESMKMEYAIPSPVVGVVSRVSVTAGRSVRVGDVLMEIDVSRPLDRKSVV